MLMTWLWCSSRPSVPHGSKDPKPVPLRFVGPVWRLKYVISVLEQHRSRLALKRAPAPTVETKARQGTCDHFSEHHGLCLSFSGNTEKPWDRASGWAQLAACAPAPLRWHLRAADTAERR